MADRELIPNEPASVLLADGHALFRSGMRHLLQELSGPPTVTEAGSRAETFQLLGKGAFDLILTSLFFLEAGSERFLKRVLDRSKSARLIVVSGVHEPAVIRNSLRAGAAGYILKDTAPEITLQAIRLVLAGGLYVPSTMIGSVLPPGAPKGAVAPLADARELTERQREVLHLLSQGGGNKLIARELGLSPGAVKAHVASLLRVFGASNRTALVVRAGQCGALSSPVEEFSGERRL